MPFARDGTVHKLKSPHWNLKHPAFAVAPAQESPAPQMQGRPALLWPTKSKSAELPWHPAEKVLPASSPALSWWTPASSAAAWPLHSPALTTSSSCWRGQPWLSHDSAMTAPPKAPIDPLKSQRRTDHGRKTDLQHLQTWIELLGQGTAAIAIKATELHCILGLRSVIHHLWMFQGNLCISAISAQLVSPWVLEDVLNFTPCYTQLNHSLFQEQSKHFSKQLVAQWQRKFANSAIVSKVFVENKFQFGGDDKTSSCKNACLAVPLGVDMWKNKVLVNRALLLQLLLRLAAFRPIYRTFAWRLHPRIHGLWFNPSKSKKSIQGGAVFLPVKRQSFLACLFVLLTWYWNYLQTCAATCGDLWVLQLPCMIHVYTYSIYMCPSHAPFCQMIAYELHNMNYIICIV